MITNRKWLLGLALAVCVGGAVGAADPSKTKWIQSTAYAIPKETATEGEGYFSIIEGHNGRLYIGTHCNGVNSWLVEFDPATKKMKIVVDAMKEIGSNVKGLRGPGQDPHPQQRRRQRQDLLRHQAGLSRPSKGEKREDYPGGYPMVYDPETGKTKVYPIPVPHQGINSITPDESRGVAYISTCADGRPGPGENSHFLILDLKTGKYRDLIDTKHVYGFIVVDYLGRAYHPMLGGDIVRYDPKTDKVESLKQTIDGKAPTKESNLVNSDVHVAVQKATSPGGTGTLYQTQVTYPTGHPINWDISPDGKTLYSLPMSTNAALRLRPDGDRRHAARPHRRHAGSGREEHRLPGDVRRAEGRGLGGDHRNECDPGHLQSASSGQLSARRQGAARSWCRRHPQSGLHRVHGQEWQAAAIRLWGGEAPRRHDHVEICDPRCLPGA